MQKIIPNIWFDKEAEEAANFYVSAFGGDSKMGSIIHYTKAGIENHGQPVGSVMSASFEIEGYKFTGINGGPIFKPNPSISFMVAYSTKEEVDALWSKLLEGGKVLMELAKYSFSEWYGWVQDKYGLSWQVIFMGDRPVTSKITPTLMFVGDVYGKAEEAVNAYVSIFHDSKAGEIMQYTEDQAPDKPGTIAHAMATLEGQEFAFMDSAREHDFSFNEAVSLLIDCRTQEEIDYYWDKLSEGGDPKAQVCGWLKDKFGVSWQVAPGNFDDKLNDPDTAKVERLTNAFMKMKKFDLAELERVFNQ